MLFSILKSDADFSSCIQKIAETYYPEKAYRSIAAERFGAAPTPKQIETLIPEVSVNMGYSCFGLQTQLPMPFLKYFHQLFLKRKQDAPPPKTLNDMCALELSQNAGNHAHFVNVVAYTARLIQFFSDTDNVQILFRTHNFYSSKYNEGVNPAQFKFDPNGDLRTIKLLLAAYYHDIGKAVIDRRHAVEGAIILSDHTSQAWYDLSEIIKKCGLKKFDADDLLSISEFVFHHDHFGTLSTGESGYVKTSALVDRLKRFSFRDSVREKQKEGGVQTVFDLWVLNVADILSSVEVNIENPTVKLNKWVQHSSVWSSKANADKRIHEFLRLKENEPNQSKYPYQANCLIHDLLLSVKLQEIHNESKHSDDLSKLAKASQNAAVRHTVERLRRLVWNTIFPSKGSQSNGVKFNVFKDDASTNERRILESLVKYFEDHFTEEHQILPIYRAIDATTQFEVFCQKLSWVGQMDYALGFFQKIAEHAWKRVVNELCAEDQGNKSIRRTGWVRDNTKTVSKDFLLGMGGLVQNETLKEIQANFFYNNYVSIVVQILVHILNKDHAWNAPVNLEFSDSRDRLTEEKMDKLMSLEGPFRNTQTTNLLLQTVFLY